MLADRFPLSIGMTQLFETLSVYDNADFSQALARLKRDILINDRRLMEMSAKAAKTARPEGPNQIGQSHPQAILKPPRGYPEAIW